LVNRRWNGRDDLRGGNDLAGDEDGVAAGAGSDDDAGIEDAGADAGRAVAVDGDESAAAGVGDPHEQSPSAVPGRDEVWWDRLGRHSLVL
jgi:hypothetical protein